MSYQDYAQLGKGSKRRDDGNNRPKKRESDRIDRPYNGPTASFSVPRPSPPHSSSSSTSSATLSPSNSASQKDNGSPTAEWNNAYQTRGGGGDGALANQVSLARLRELDVVKAAVGEKRPNLIDADLPWRPSYLRRRILAIFLGVFAILIISLEVVGSMSNRNAGLRDGNSIRATRYVWTYLPLLGLTVLAGMWTRVDYQAKIAAPWIRMSRGLAPAEKTLLVDYVNMSLPVSIVKAIVNRDVVVICTSVVRLHLGLLVVISTALLTMSLVSVPSQNASITLNTAFVNDAGALAKSDPFAFFAMVGLQQDNLSYPDGVSSRFAYQQISADVPIGTEIRATVDGFSAGLECEAAQLSLAGAQYYKTGIQLNTTISVPGCSVNLPVFSKTFLSNLTTIFSRFDHGGCGGSNSTEDQRIVVVFGSETATVPRNATVNNVPINATISQSMQLICKPTYAISRLDIAKSGIAVVDLDIANTENRTLSNVQPWDIAQAFFNSYTGSLVGNFSDTSPSFYQPALVTVDAAMYLALGMRKVVAGTAIPLSALLDRTTLQSVADDYFRQYTALMASRSLIEETSSSTAGTVALRGERLLVQSLVAQLMVAMLGVSMILTTVAICFVPRKGLLPRDPGTIIDTAALIAHSRPLLQSLRGAGGGSDKVLWDRLSGTKYSIGVEAYEHGSSSDTGYFKIFQRQSTKQQVGAAYVEETENFSYPINLHPLVRIASFIAVIALIILLEVILRASQNNNGLMDVMDDKFSHLLWTAVPAILLSHFTDYFASVDFTMRALAPYAALRDGSSFQSSVSLNYLDKITAVAIYESATARNLAVAAAGMTVLLSSMFVAFTAPIFSEMTVPATASVQLLARDFFPQSNSTPNSDTCIGCQNGTVVASLILNANLAYPAFTYEALNFPALALDTSQGPSTYPDDIILTASLPAIRPSMACRMIKQTEIIANLTISTDQADESNSFSITLPGEPQGGAADSSSTLVISTGRKLQDTLANAEPVDPNAFFGASAYKPFKSENGTTVSHWVYAWGQFANADSNQTTLRSIFAMSCNESVEQVNSMTNFHGTSLTILPSDPPLVDESSAMPVTVSLSGNWDYSELANVSTSHALDQFFASLVASRYAIPVEDLGDSSADVAQRVADAIVFQHKVIRAQVINTSGRRPMANDDSSVRKTSNGGVASFPATATSNTVAGDYRQSLSRRAAAATSMLTARRRLVQDVVATRVLQSLLSVTLFLSIVSWVLQRRTNILPRTRSPSSIASVAALLADGNIFGLLGRTAEWSSVEELRGLFMDGIHVTMGFRMGWEAPRRRRRDETLSKYGVDGRSGGGTSSGAVFGVSAMRTGGWGGGEGVGLGLQARVGYVHRRHVKDWGWRT